MSQNTSLSSNALLDVINSAYSSTKSAVSSLFNGNTIAVIIFLLIVGGIIGYVIWKNNNQ